MVISNRKKDNLEGSLIQVLLAAELKSPKILIPRLLQNKSNVNVESIRKSKQLHYLQKQPSRGVLRKRYSENMQEIYRKTPMPKGDLLKFQSHLYIHS